MEFTDLIAIFEMSGWQALGKIPHPLTGKNEVNLESAKNTIEILCLLRDKSRNNLTPEEDKHLAAAIANLQLNFAAEAEKKPDAPTPESEQKTQDKTS